MRKELDKIIKKAILESFGIKDADFSVEYARDEKFGDYSTNAAMVLGKVLKKSPMEVAEQIVTLISNLLPEREKRIMNFFQKIEIMAPGYINFYLSEKYLQDKVAEIQDKKEKYGSSEIGRGVKINNEFISANPTGPLHLGNGRGGFYGDTLSNILKKTGFEVVNEYYVNDAGEQVVKLGHSVSFAKVQP